uniref:Slc15a-6 n=1 Tax=Schmidtea mediterranea TaxID=79327 RepID=A0A0H3YF88_SCHMD|nr:slc15a-6 [Schmidtea mediterranea]
MPQKSVSALSSFKPVIFCILVFELCERLTFYSISANFVRFCTIFLQVDNVTAMNMSLIFTGSIYIVTLFCGWISDSVLGKFKTIILSGIIYFIGVLLITAVTFQSEPRLNITLSLTLRRVLTGFGLVFIGIATGGIKSTVGPFGAEQLDQKNENITRLFFIWYYWFVNLGSAIAFLGVTYVQQNINFFIGFIIPLVSISVAMVLFIIPHRFYKRNESFKNTSSIFTYVSIFWEAFQRRSRSIYKYSQFLDYASLSNGGSYDDTVIADFRKTIRIIPVLLTFIPFYIAYSQMQSTYLLQAERLNLNISTFVIPVASLNVVNTVVILFIIPLLAILVYPILNKCFKASPNHLKRIALGLFLSSLSVIAAGVLEIYRKDEIRATGGIPQTVFNKSYNVSHISVLAQIPQFFFVGSGEVFASATGLEFAYSQAPVSMQAVITGLFYVMTGIGSFASSLLILLVNVNLKDQWMPDDIDKGHYESFFFLLGGIILLDVTIFIFIARGYRYSTSEEEKKLLIIYDSRYDDDDKVALSQ